MPWEKKTKSLIYKKKGMSLKSKLILNTTILIAIMDILIVIAFGIYMIKSQENTLATGLLDRSKVMLMSIDRSTQVYLPLARKDDALSILDLTDTASQSKALHEAVSVSITSLSSDEKGEPEITLWASTDADIKSKTRDGTFIPGESEFYTEDLYPAFESLLETEKLCAEACDSINEKIKNLMTQTEALSGKTDAESNYKRQQLLTERSTLLSKLNGILDEISSENIKSIPEFDTKNISKGGSSYTFIKPVLYRQENNPSYIHGAIVMEISTAELLEQIDETRSIIIKTGLLITLAAIIIAFISTYRISVRIVKPINKLVSHVAMIRDTKDKETLDGKTISINSKDEIEMLGDTVNEMTRDLVEAAVQSKSLTFGKEVQAKFLPLETGANGHALTTGRLNTNGADFFSYYAGADDLSGDYFDYKQIDSKHFAVIKCDVSGHGVPAALIMVEVATLFLNYFSHWDMKNPEQGTNLGPVVGRINDLLESRGFKGRFAAFTLCILNTESGECWFCNAGDNAVQLYDI